MGFYEEWHEQHAQQIAERLQEIAKLPAKIAQVREQWLGRRVWVQSSFFAAPVYGEVVSVDESGLVKVVYWYDADDQPVFIGVALELVDRWLSLAE